MAQEDTGVVYWAMPVAFTETLVPRERSDDKPETTAIKLFIEAENDSDFTSGVG